MCRGLLRKQAQARDTYGNRPEAANSTGVQGSQRSRHEPETSVGPVMEQSGARDICGNRPTSTGAGPKQVTSARTGPSQQPQHEQAQMTLCIAEQPQGALSDARVP